MIPGADQPGRGDLGLHPEDLHALLKQVATLWVGPLQPHCTDNKTKALGG